MPFFRKKPVVIEAVQVPMPDQVMEHGTVWGFFYRHSFKGFRVTEDKGYDVDTGAHGWAHASPGDWIIRGVEGEFYPVPDRVLKATYDPVEPDL